MQPDSLVDDLDPEQREAATIDGPVVRVLAGAGSGKTRVLTHRVAHRVATRTMAADRALVVTFTREAAGELRMRLRSLGLRDNVAAATLHATALAMVRRHARDRGYMPPSLITRPASVLGKVIKADNLDVDTRLALAEIDWARSRRVSPARYEDEAAALGRTPPIPSTSMSRLMLRYDTYKSERRLSDFTDLLVDAGKALRTDNEFGRAQRWRYRHLFIDEFQDLTPLQYWFVQALAGPDPDMFLVGDPNQSIYGWNGSDPSLLDQVERDYPIVRTVRLTTNYRCSPEIVAASGSLLSDAPLAAHRPGGPPLIVTPTTDDASEGHLIARLVRDARAPGTPWSQIAVLARTRQVVTRIAHALTAAGIPAAGSSETERADRDLLQRAVDDLYHGATDIPISSIRFDLQQQLSNQGARPDAIAIFDEFAALDSAATVADFSAWIESVRPNEIAPWSDSVAVLTFHGAKGHKWPVVILAGVEEGLVPIYGSDTDEQRLAEEQRLLYVALTRASDQLHLTWAARRNNHDRKPSRWIIPIIEAESSTAQLAAPVDWRDAVGEARGSLASASTAASPFAPALESRTAFESLEKWRARIARASSVSPEAIVSSATLRAIADQSPDSLEALSAIPGLGASTVSRFGGQMLEALIKGE